MTEQERGQKYKKELERERGTERNTLRENDIDGKREIERVGGKEKTVRWRRWNQLVQFLI